MRTRNGANEHGSNGAVSSAVAEFEFVFGMCYYEIARHIESSPPYYSAVLYDRKPAGIKILKSKSK